MKTNNHSEIGWHMILGAIVFLMLVPIVFALSNSFKTLQDAFNTIFEIIPSHPTAFCPDNLKHISDRGIRYRLQNHYQPVCRLFLCLF